MGHYGPAWAHDFSRPEFVEAHRQIRAFREKSFKNTPIVAAALLAAGMLSPAHAQDKTFSLTVTAQDLQVMSAALDELPRKISQPVVEKLQKQLIPQMQATEAPKNTEALPKEDKK